jgi:hypothetical protein
MARELDDAILLLRANELELGTWILKTAGDAGAALAMDATLERFASDWFVRETIGMLRRTLARLDVTSRTLYALIEPGSCFAGTLLELALAADRSYMLQLPDAPDEAPRIALSELNFGAYPMVNHLSRITTRFCELAEPVEEARQVIGEKLDAIEAIATADSQTQAIREQRRDAEEAIADTDVDLSSDVARPVSPLERRDEADRSQQRRTEMTDREGRHRAPGAQPALGGCQDEDECDGAGDDVTAAQPEGAQDEYAHGVV